MTILKRILCTLAIVAVVLVAVAYLLPREVVVARSITIKAAPEVIFPYVNDLRKFNEWSPWAKIDPNTKYTYDGAASGKGQKMTWVSSHKDVGNGSEEIIESVANKRVRYALDFGDHGTAKAIIRLKPKDVRTKVIWGFSTDTGMNPMMRYMGLMMDKMVGEKYDQGLADLKKLVESQG